MGSYRDRLQIIADILSVTSKHAKKTQIMYQANLSYRLLCRYLSEVLNAGLVSIKNGDFYVPTAKGKEFLKKYEEYLKRRKRLKEQLNCINNVKTELKRMCSYASVISSDVNGRDV
jgi:predicted transcriptional regulator